jgi:hypothetical protein
MAHLSSVNVFRTSNSLRFVGTWLASFLVACGGITLGVSDGGTGDGRVSDSEVDASGHYEAGAARDTGVLPDLGVSEDTGVPPDAARFASCGSDPCSATQFCVNWVDGPHGGPKPYSQCLELPGSCVADANCTCVETAGVPECLPSGCEGEAGAVVLTCTFPSSP